jgi:hypothetical protein
MGADCKSVGLRLPRFESWTCHHAAEPHDAGIVQCLHMPRAIAELGAAQSVDTLRCLISHVLPSGTKVSR